MDIYGILLSEGAAAPGSQSGTLFMIVYVVVLVLMMVFMFNGPQKKEKKRLEAMLNDLAIGDNVLTTSGFYGMVIDISDDTVIVEFGSNKNCRIPMTKNAISQVEKPGTPAPSEDDKKKGKKDDKKEDKKVKE